MKRLALVALAAGFWPGSPTRGADTPCAPAPAQFAPTVPTVPPPTFCNGAIVPGGAGCEPARGRLFAGPRLFDVFGSRATPCEPYDPCKPAAAAVPTDSGKVVTAGGRDCGTGGCVTPAGHTGQKWECVKAWLCYRQTPAKLPLTPTAHTALPLFPCQPKGLAGCGDSGACGPAGCAPGNGGAGAVGQGAADPAGPRVGGGKLAGAAGAGLLHSRGAHGGATAGGNGGPPCDMSSPDIAGYRFAAPESHRVTGKPYTGSVSQLAYKVPVGPVVKPPPAAPSLGVPFTKP